MNYHGWKRSTFDVHSMCLLWLQLVAFNWGNVLFTFNKARTAAAIMPMSTSRPCSPVDEDYSISAITMSSCAGYLLVGGNDGLVWLLNLHNLEPIHCLPRCKSPITSFSLTQDQRWVLTRKCFFIKRWPMNPMFSSVCSNSAYPIGGSQASL